MSFRITHFPLIELPLVLATSNASAVKGLVALGSSPENARAYVKEVAPDNAAGWVIMVEGTDGVKCALMVAKKKDLNTVAHEAVHVVNRAFQWADIHCTYEDDEIQAYSVGWLVEEFCKPWPKIPKEVTQVDQ